MTQPGASPCPSPAPWLEVGVCRLAARIVASYRQAFGRPLLAGGGVRHGQTLAQELFCCDTVVLAHDGQADPRLTYANAGALNLWVRPWAVMVGMPSRLTADPQEQPARAAALATALRQDAIQDYSGVRIDSRGRRFQIHQARIWTLTTSEGEACGQAAAFGTWWWL